MNRPTQRVPGYNVDALDVAAGLRELKTCGYSEPETVMVIEYALMRWARGEESQAERRRDRLQIGVYQSDRWCN